jgi:hypothetical protein
MPNGMDLEEITQWWKDSVPFLSGGVAAPSSLSGRVAYTFNNIFVQTPVQMCQGVAEKPDTNIQVNVTSPGQNAVINSPFTISYSVTAPKNIRRVLILLNKQQVALFEYPQGNTKSISDTKQVTIT